MRVYNVAHDVMLRAGTDWTGAGGCVMGGVTVMEMHAKAETREMGAGSAGAGGKDCCVLSWDVATGQETRLVKTGKYKELQRLNIKRAITFMLDNYDLRDRFVAASAFAPLEQQHVMVQNYAAKIERVDHWLQQSQLYFTRASL